MTTESKNGLCAGGKWAIDGDNIGHCAYYQKTCTQECAEKGIRDYNKLQIGLFGRYGELNRKFGQINIAKKESAGISPEVIYAIKDLAWRGNL